MQFRERPEELDFLRSEGINPNEFAREAFRARLDALHRETRRLRMEEAQRRFQAASKRHPLPKPIRELVREDRESH